MVQQYNSANHEDQFTPKIPIVSGHTSFARLTYASFYINHSTHHTQTVGGCHFSFLLVRFHGLGLRFQGL